MGPLAITQTLLLVISPPASPPRQSCANWCHLKLHCGDAACGACALCTSEKREACAPRSANDIPFKGCQGWCNVAQKQAHCANCACKTCEFCASGETAADPPPAVCTPHSAGDSSERRCEAFCSRPNPKAA
eukprot:3557344-Prymnesium_polylepis.1